MFCFLEPTAIYTSIPFNKQVSAHWAERKTNLQASTLTEAGTNWAQILSPADQQGLLLQPKFWFIRNKQNKL